MSLLLRTMMITDDDVSTDAGNCVMSMVVEEKLGS